jgi:hypothetical protein
VALKVPKISGYKPGVFHDLYAELITVACAVQ